MKEIGGYLGLEQFVHHEYYSNLISLNNARNALLYILKARTIRKLYIPYFLCDSVSELCDREGYSYEFYHIDNCFQPIFEQTLAPNEYLYIVNYYGQIDNSQIAALKGRYQRIIVDNVQAFFQQPLDGIDTIYSCRKFFGVPDGAYLSTSAVLETDLPEDISKDRMRHLLGRFEGKCASDYYEDFKLANYAFSELELRTMSRLTHNLLGAIDYYGAKQKRERNYAFLNAHLKSCNKLVLKDAVGPYAYPFYCNNGIEVKRKLAEKKIYVPTLWPNVRNLEGTLEKDYAENILPLPCDQRYDFDDMNRIVEEVLNLYMKGV